MKNVFRSLQLFLFLVTSCVLFSSQKLLLGQDLKNLDPIIEKYSTQYGVDKYLVKSIIQISSGGNSKTVSSSGAIGLMQLMPSVISNMGVKNPYDTEENIKGGCKYLKALIDQFEDIELSVAAFNAGPGEVEKHGKPVNKETKKFVEDIMRTYKLLKDSKSKSEVFGKWSGTGRYIKYDANPPLKIDIIGRTEPFEIEITPNGDGVILNTERGVIGDPSQYHVQLGANSLYVEYTGPNPFGIPIPNATTTYFMSFVFNITTNENMMKGNFSSKNTTKVVYHIPDLEIPESNVEIYYELNLNLKKK
jgi:hypothetical protein